MAVIHRKQLSAMGIHYLYYPLDYMLDAQAKAGFQTVELVGMAPHFLMDHTGFQDTAPVRKMAEDRGLTIGCFTPECAVYQYLMRRIRAFMSAVWNILNGDWKLPNSLEQRNF